MSRYGATSRARLATCHPVLQDLMDRAIASAPTGLDWSIICGHRTKEAQEAAVAAKTSQLRWPKSKHNRFPSMAVDLAPYVDGAVSWDWAHFHPVAAHIKATWEAMPEAHREGFSLSWGGDWRDWPDGPHWELR